MDPAFGGDGRLCEVCGGRDLEFLHGQPFRLPGGQRVSYDVVACVVCGFGFARNLPSSQELEAYYAGNRKYLYEGSDGEAPGHVAVQAGLFHLLDRFLQEQPIATPSTSARILDVGCSTGRLLSSFARAGYTNLLGVDPAPECREAAERLHGVEVVTAPLSEFRPSEPFDVVLLSSVLEHLVELPRAMAQIVEFLRPGGVLLVQVPDADRFGLDPQEPFLEFSIEHVNYFTRQSLENLLRPRGLAPVLVRDEVANVGRTSFPVLTSLWIRADTLSSVTLRRNDPGPLRRYVDLGRERLAGLEKVLASLADSGEEVILWGAGSLAARLMETASLGAARIVGVVDSNTGLHGKTFAGHVIAPTASLRGRRTPVLVASYVWAEEICNTLSTVLCYEGRVLTLP